MLRPIELNEAELVADLITEKISNWTAQIPWPYKIEDAVEWIESSSPQQRLGIYLKNGKLIGTFRIPQSEDEEIGFIISEKYENLGYATETLKAAVEYIFKNRKVEEIHSSAHPDNLASKRVHEKAGFIFHKQIVALWKNKNAELPVNKYILKNTN